MFCARITFFAVIGKNAPPGHFRQTRHCARCRSPAPLLVHFVRGVKPQLEKLRLRIDQLRDALPRRQAVLLVLRVDCLCAASLPDDFLLVLDLGQAFNHLPAVFLKRRRLPVNRGVDNSAAHAAPFRRVKLAARNFELYQNGSFACARWSAIAHRVKTAAANNSPAVTTRETSPEANASSAFSRAPVVNISIARPRPINRVRRCVPPQPVIIPIAPPGCPNTASFAAMRARQASARSSPPPMQYPRIAAITGFGDRSIPRNTACPNRENSNP